jgi:non-ribosomal peptide synthetase component F
LQLFETGENSRQSREAFENEQLTYVAKPRANQHAVCKHWKPEQKHVGLSVARSAEMVVALLGIIKPVELYRSTRTSSGPAGLHVGGVSNASCLPWKFSCNQLQSSCDLDRDWGSISQYSGENLLNNTQPDNHVHHFTSGSTGNPKGVRIPQAWLL